jgi:hypothetical protein
MDRNHGVLNYLEEGGGLGPGERTPIDQHQQLIGDVARVDDL